MRQIKVSEIIECVAHLCIKANRLLPEDTLNALRSAKNQEKSAHAQNVLDVLIENCRIAREEKLPLCQDTGITIVFVELGQEVKIVGDLYSAINEGVRKGYKEGYLRKSIVTDPILRNPTGENTPAVIYTTIIEGKNLKITVMPKGAGSENASALIMMLPAKGGNDAIIKWVLQHIKKVAQSSCPPLIVGIGIGGTFEQVGLMAKQALLRSIGIPSSIPHLALLEKKLLEKINRLDIGPGGLGGYTTCLSVHIQSAPTHIAMLPVAVNVSCYANRHQTEVL